MAIHPNLRKGSISPKEKAAQLAGQSTGTFNETAKKVDYLFHIMQFLSR